MSFQEQTSAFFDEISSILDAQKADREKEIDKRTGRPFSSQLTQDEEPIYDHTPTQYDEAEPEVVVRGS